MRQFVFASAFLVALCLASACIASEQGQSPAPQPIRAVWAEKQICSGITAQSLSQYSDAEQIKGDGVVELKRLGVRYKIPYVPKVEKFVLRMVLDDNSRRVVDNYILISDDDLKAPFGALLVTTLPPVITSAESAFNAVDTLQRGLAGSAYQFIERREINDARLGHGLEYISPNRVGTLCCPTARYQFVPAGMSINSIGISRFFVRGNELIELSYIVILPESVAQSGRNDFARSEMDRYIAGLTLSDPVQ